MMFSLNIMYKMYRIMVQIRFLEGHRSSWMSPIGPMVKDPADIRSLATIYIDVSATQPRVILYIANSMQPTVVLVFEMMNKRVLKT